MKTVNALKSILLCTYSLLVIQANAGTVDVDFKGTLVAHCAMLRPGL